MLGSKADGGLKHFERGGVGGGIGTTGLAEHGFHFRYGLDQSVRLLRQTTSLRRRDTWQCRWHVKEVTFVHLRNELPDQPVYGPRLVANTSKAMSRTCFGRAKAQSSVDCR